jgi:hypothetical protein
MPFRSAISTRAINVVNRMMTVAVAFDLPRDSKERKDGFKALDEAKMEMAMIDQLIEEQSQ